MRSKGSPFNRYRKPVFGLLLGLVLILLAACQPAAPAEETMPAAEPTAQIPVTGSTALPSTPAASATEMDAAMSAVVEVSDQDIQAGQIMVDRVVSPGPGWIVIHVQQDGNPGPVIGHSAVQAGENLDVVVAVDEALATETVYAMLHDDLGTVGTYEFPGADVPTMVDGQMVNPSFAIGNAMATASGEGAEYEAMATPVMGEVTRVEVGEDATLGQFLVDAEGMTLYMFTRDPPNQSVCEGGCLEAWPPLLTDGEVEAGEGITAELGVIERPDGSMQVTANGMPLYYYAPDTQPGDTTGQGVGEVWYLVAPDGSVIQ